MDEFTEKNTNLSDDDNLSKTIEFDSEQLKYLILDLWDQYINFSNISISYIDKNTTLPHEDIVDILNYINDNYISICNLQIIINDPLRAHVVHYYIYKLIVQDLIKQIIPNILINGKLLGLKTIDDLYKIDIIKFRELLLSYITKYIKNLTFINDKSNNSNIELKNEILNWTYYLDLFDNDLMNFKTNVIDKLLRLYEDEIYINT